MTKLYVALYSRLAELRDREEGQTFAEYSVLVAVVAILLVAALALFRGQIATAFDNIGDSLTAL